jgi:nucleoside-diphosphate-sugar epimerase
VGVKKQKEIKMYYKDKKVVVTGGSGFVGTNFILELLERGADVTTHTHNRPMRIQDERIKVVKDIDLFKLDDCIKLLEGADYVINCGGPVTVGDIVDAVLKATGRNPKVVYDETKPTTIPFRMVSTERIQNELGFKPKYTFEEGIKKTVEWYLETMNE